MLLDNLPQQPTLLSLTGVGPKSRGADVSTGSLGHLKELCFVMTCFRNSRDIKAQAVSYI